MTEFAIYFHGFALSVGVFALLWPLSVILRDASIADLWWGPGLGAAIGVVWLVDGGEGGARGALIAGLAAAWGLRLGLLMAARKLRHRGEDRRYRIIRAAWGAAFWWKSLFIVFLLQGVLQALVALGPMSAVAAPPAPLGLLAWAGLALALAGLALEIAADRQLDRFKAANPPDALCDTGLRAHIRHPNYLGEMAFWWGVWLIGAAAAPWWSVLSPLLLSILIVKVSGAPMIAEVLQKTRPGYADYAARVPSFIPRF